jgi:hypothetical protein
MQVIMGYSVNLTGIYLGLFMLFAIGIGFWWVIKLEFYVGAQISKWVLALGLILTLASLFFGNFWVSALVGIFGGSVVWGATELPDQEERVRRGIFPANPKRSNEGTEE